MRLLHFDTIDSTNEEAKRLLRSGQLREPAYLLAREQTAGRASRGRRWESPKDAGIYLTVVEYPLPPGLTDATVYTLAAGVASVEAIRPVTGIDVRLKPVNDLYVNGYKLGGILTEIVLTAGSRAALLTGVGINVRRAERPVGPAAAEPVCLEEVMSPDRFQALDVEALVATLVTGIRSWHAAVSNGQAELVRKTWESYRLDAVSVG